ncbi:MAG TPA: hypothetical protein V6C90_09975 [Coleofasciculaceae cyanobacterium]
MPGDNSLGRLVQQPTVQALPCRQAYRLYRYSLGDRFSYPLGNRYLE